MKDTEREEADARLLEALLVERFGGRGAVDGDEAAAAAAPAAEPSQRRAPWLLAAAVLLLGVVVVAATWFARGLGSPAANEAQDPVAPSVVEIPDLATFRRLCGEVTRVRLLRREAIGAFTRVDDQGVSDLLETVTLPEAFEVAADDLALWRDGLRDSVESSDSNTFDDLAALELGLDGGRVARLSVSLTAGRIIAWLNEDLAVHVEGGAAERLRAAHAAVVSAHRRALGIVDSAAELQALPADARRVDMPVDVAAAPGPAACLPAVERLRLRGDPDAAAWRTVRGLTALRELELVGCTFGDESRAALAGLTQLTGLVLRDCAPLPATVARQLAAMRGLAKLQLIGTRCGEQVDLSLLASLPSLAEFGLVADEPAPTAADVDAIAHTKLRRLVLVGVSGGVELERLAALPTLCELVLVGRIDDADLQRVGGLRGLRRLVVRNAHVTGEGIAELRRVLPECAVDAALNARWFDPKRAFDCLPPLR